MIYPPPDEENSVLRYETSPELWDLAKEIFEDLNKKYIRLIDYCKKEGVDKSEILMQARTGKILLYVFCKNASTSNLRNNDIVDPYLVPHLDPLLKNELVSSKREVMVSVGSGATPWGKLVSLDDLLTVINFFNNAGWPGFYELELCEAQELYAAGKTICKSFQSRLITGKPLPGAGQLAIKVEVTIDNVCIFEDELKDFLSLAKPEIEEPPLLALANQCWSEVFGHDISVYGLISKIIRLKISEIIKEKVEKKTTNIVSKLNKGQIDDLIRIITPSKFSGLKILKSYPDCSKNNKNGHTFYAEALATAKEKWHEFTLLPAKDRKLKELNQLLKSIDNDKSKNGGYYNRIHFILTYDVDFSSSS